MNPDWDGVMKARAREAKPFTTTFEGGTFQAELDLERLTSALDRVRALMRDQRWRSLEEIAAACQCSEAGASARLRDLRKNRHGNHVIERRRRGDPTRGLFEYRMVR